VVFYGRLDLLLRPDLPLDRPDVALRRGEGHQDPGDRSHRRSRDPKASAEPRELPRGNRQRNRQQHQHRHHEGFH